MKIGSYEFSRPLVLAPMAGVTDMPFRSLCNSMGADYAVSEMIATKTELWKSKKTQTRLSLGGFKPRIVQLVGGDEVLMAEGAARACDSGADIVDINMGCPAKKVCRKAAGSALLSDPTLVIKILRAVVKASESPVTLKMRTGPSQMNKNGVTIAKIAESEGISAIAIHGRTRNCRYDVPAEYETIAAIKDSIGIPVLVNGDIRCGSSAFKALSKTNADGLMIGRAAQGNPWIFSSIRAALDGERWNEPSPIERLEVLHSLLESLYQLYGKEQGSRVARKHIIWFLSYLPIKSEINKATMNKIKTSHDQLNFVQFRKREFENKG